MPNQLKRACRDEIDVRKNLNAEEQLYNQLDEKALSIVGEEGLLKYPPGFGDVAQPSGMGGRNSTANDGSDSVTEKDDSRDFSLYNQLDSTASSLIGEGRILKNPIVYSEDGAKSESEFTDTSSHTEDMEVKPLIVGNEYLVYEEIQPKRWERIVAALSYCSFLAFIPACFVGSSQFVKFHLVQSISMLARACFTALKCAIVLAVIFLCIKLLFPSLFGIVGYGIVIGMKKIAIPMMLWCITVFALGKYLVMCTKCAKEALNGIIDKHDDISFLGFL